MSESVIPVDLANPGQVFACLGFMEAAIILMPEAEISAAFDWSENPARFRLRAEGTDDDPVRTVLGFLKGAEVVAVAPVGIEAEWPRETNLSQTFPVHPKELRKKNLKNPSEINASALPVNLKMGNTTITIDHWIDGSRAETFKLFAGKQNALQIVTTMRKQMDERLPGDPFSCIDEHSSSLRAIDKYRFGFDSRGAWEAIRSGFSLDKLKPKMPSLVSPAVEILAAVGLSHTRPVSIGRKSGEARPVAYFVWMPSLPPSLARTAFANASAVMLRPREDYRRYVTHTGEDEHYKKFFPAHEETPA